jgi:Protein of unknown function (DUF3237)
MPLETLPIEFLFTITAITGDHKPVMIPNGPRGTRVLVTAMKGTFEGPKLKGVVAEAAGGDWVTIGADGTMYLDVRLTLMTDDGAAIYMSYSGVGVKDADGATIIRTAPRFETGAEQYAWLNKIQAVGHGTTVPGSVTYDIYALL